MENDSLWSNIVFKKEVISHLNNKRLLARSLLLWKHTNTSNKGVFSFIIFSQLWWLIEPKFLQSCYFMLMMGYTKWEHWSSSQLPNVYNAFKQNIFSNPLYLANRARILVECFMHIQTQPQDFSFQSVVQSTNKWTF